MGERTDGVLKRRGLLAGAAAVAATGLAKLGVASVRRRGTMLAGTG